MKSLIASVTAIGAMTVVGWNFGAVQNEVAPPAKPVGLDAHESNAAASLLGQFRTSSSTWLWLKTDLYLHNGVEMRMLSEGEIKAGQEAIRDKDGWHQAIGDKSALTTTIPDAARDFRGVFGDIERATSAYSSMQGHTHNDPKSALPLFRLMTWLDPSFLSGWVAGAMVIGEDRSAESAEKAIVYLREGLEANPDSIALRTEIARIFISRKDDLKTAIPLLKQGVELTIKHRESLAEDELESALDCFRWLALCYADEGRTGDSIRTALRGIELLGDDPVLARQTKPQPLLLADTKADIKVEVEPHKHDASCNHAH